MAKNKMEKKERNRPRLYPMLETAVRARLSRWNVEFVKDVSFFNKLFGRTFGITLSS